jgi:hypothetical protein
MMRLLSAMAQSGWGGREAAEVQNFDLLIGAEFREMHGFTIPAWLVNSERCMAFNFEGCEDADGIWLQKVIGQKVKPGHFSFYFGPGTTMDEHLCRAILVRLALFDLNVDMFPVETPQAVHVSS